MDGFEMEPLAVQFRRRDLTIALKFPGKDRGEIVVVTQSFSFRRLMFLAKMGAARFIASKCVETHQLGEFQKIGHATGAFERLIKIFTVTRDPDFAPESVA